MSCEICGRGACTRSFHSLEAQEAFDNGTDSFDGEPSAFQSETGKQEQTAAHPLPTPIELLRELCTAAEDARYSDALLGNAFRANVKSYRTLEREAAELRAQLAEVKEALAGDDYASLPSDYPLVRMAHTIRADHDKFRNQVIDTCKRAETAERQRGDHDGQRIIEAALTALQSAEHLAPEDDAKAKRRCKCEFSSGGVWAKKCAFHAALQSREAVVRECAAVCDGLSREGSDEWTITRSKAFYDASAAILNLLEKP